MDAHVDEAHELDGVDDVEAVVDAQRRDYACREARRELDKAVAALEEMDEEDAALLMSVATHLMRVEELEPNLE